LHAGSARDVAAVISNVNTDGSSAAVAAGFASLAHPAPVEATASKAIPHNTPPDTPRPWNLEH
jgi:hypothetical protein